MFASLSRGSSTFRQAYVCSSCLSSLLTHPHPATLVVVHPTPRAISYSTSTNSKPENDAASEAVEIPKADISLEDEKSPDVADAANGNGANGGKPRRSRPKRMLSESKIALQILRKELAKDGTEVEGARRSKRSIHRAQRAAEVLEKLKQKKEVKGRSKVEKVKKTAKEPALKSLGREGKCEVSTKSQDVEDSVTDSPENQDRTKKKKPPLARRVLSNIDQGPGIKQTPKRLDNRPSLAYQTDFLHKNPTIAEKVLKLQSSKATSPDDKMMTMKNSLVILVQDGKLSPAERRITLKHLKSSIVGKAYNEQLGIRSLKSAMTSKVPFRGAASGRSAAVDRFSAGGRGRPVKAPIRRSKPGPIVAKPGMTAHEIETIEANELKLLSIDKEPPSVPSLSYGLERVLFNPGVYHLQDPRSRVFNFDPYLQTIMPVNDFDFSALKQYITSSRDKTLLSKAKQEEKKYTGSTSSMTSALGHFHFLLSQWRPINTGILSQMFPVEYNTFTALQRGPTAVFLRWRDGTYAIDADKQYDNSNILMMLGKSMEKLLTLSTEDFEKYRKANSDQISEEQRNESEPFHYTTIGDFLLRSQLDAHDSRLPGSGMFDLKTRAVISVRMDADAWKEGKGYQIRGRHGEWESFEREYYDMIRAAFLKYSLQVRMGRMDGIFVAFHNTERIFGFQYISLPEMDYALHGTDNTAIGDSEFKLSLELLNRVLDRATAKFPEKSLRLHFETRDGVTPFMYIFAEPIEEEEVEKIQATNKQKIEAFERSVLGLEDSELTEEQKQAEWASLRAKVEERMEEDELGIENPDTTEGQNDSGLDELFDEEQENVDNLLSSAAMEEDGHEDDDDEDTLIEDLEEDDEESLQDGEGHNEEGEEIMIDDPANDLDRVVEGSRVGDVEELDESFEESNLHEQAAAEEILSGDFEEAESDEDAADEQESFADEESNEDELISLESEGDNTELIENKELKSDETSSDSTIEDIAVASGATNPGGPFRIPQGPTYPPLLAMTLIIRNKVNDRYVERPNNLQGHENWAVEYALSEVPQPRRAHELYDALKTRRKKAVTRNVDLSKDAWNNVFIENIKKLSKKGQAWRAKQDEIEADLPIKTLEVRDGKKMNAKDRDVWQQGKKEEE
jgi:hypothetical protein